MAAGIHAGHRQRLKERFLRDSLASLTERETLELVLMYAIPQRDVSPLAQQLLTRFGSLSGVLEADRAALLEEDGVGENAATLLSLLPQLFGRYQQSLLGEKPVIADPESAMRYASSLFAGAHEERLYLICLDLSGRVIATVLLATGTLDEVMLYHRKVVEQALQGRAHAVLLAHNHPGGTSKPSQADVDTTRRVIEALSVVNIRVLDHVIVSDAGVYSMARGGLGKSQLPSAAACRSTAVGSDGVIPELGWNGEGT